MDSQKGLSRGELLSIMWGPEKTVLANQPPWAIEEEDRRVAAVAATAWRTKAGKDHTRRTWGDTRVVFAIHDTGRALAKLVQARWSERADLSVMAMTIDDWWLAFPSLDFEIDVVARDANLDLDWGKSRIRALSSVRAGWEGRERGGDSRARETYFRRVRLGSLDLLMAPSQPARGLTTNPAVDALANFIRTGAAANVGFIAPSEEVDRRTRTQKLLRNPPPRRRWEPPVA